MPVVVISMKAGRTVEQKRNLVRSVMEAFVDSIGVSADAVEITIIESPLENFARGGVLLSEKK
jgi:4-oxalocrotonate tautomerase